jgi:hypothetical protein
VRFVTDNERRLVFQYLLIVRQFAINQDAYVYYQSVQENNEFSGSLFDQQKGSIYGNVKSIDDKSLPVLGYFEVAGVSENRRRFNPDEFKEQGFDPVLIWAGNCQGAFYETGIYKGTRVDIDSTLISMDIDSTLLNEEMWEYDTIRTVDYLTLSAEDGNPKDTSECIIDINWVTFEVKFAPSSPCVTWCTDCRHHGFLDPPDWWEVEDND